LYYGHVLGFQRADWAHLYLSSGIKKPANNPIIMATRGTYIRLIPVITHIKNAKGITTGTNRIVAIQA
jgi:hypothetical protein